MAEITLEVRAAPIRLAVSGAQGPDSGGSSSVSDTAYDATSWNGVTTIAPSKNAVRDKFETLSSVFSPIAGSSSIVTLGTITTGVWNGTAIADGYIASAATWNAKQSALVSGTNIKTLASQSLLGSGNLALSDIGAQSTITFGTGVQTALGVNIGSAGAPVLFNGALGTPSSGTLTNCTFPTLNQNTTGSAASLSVSGQTGLITFTGTTTTSRVKTVRDAADTLLELGGSYTPSGTWAFSNTTRPTSAGTGTPASDSLITRADGDTRYGDVLLAYKTSDTSRSNAGTGTTFTDDPHLTLTVPSAGTYHVELVYPWQNADSTGGMKARLSYSGTWDTANSFINYQYFVSGSAITEGITGIGYFKGSAIANPQTIIATTQRSGYVKWTGILKFSNGGTLVVQWAQNASSATASILPQTTFVELRRSGP